MILWVLLFILVVVISFVLAVKSMHDFQEIPAHTGEEYSLFLIRRPHELTGEVLSSIHENLLTAGLIISFERLIKGTKAALVVYGPKKVLSKFEYTLDLLELEDYTGVNSGQFTAWEVVVKNAVKPGFPPVSLEDQIWWQLIMSAKKDNLYHPHIRLAAVSSDHKRREDLKGVLSGLSTDKFIKLPKTASNGQMLDYYKKRGFRKDTQNRNLYPDEVIKLLHV